MLADAITKGVSDIHFEVRKATAKVRYRIDGEWGESNQLDTQFVTAVCCVVTGEQEQSFTVELDKETHVDAELIVGEELLRVRLVIIPEPPYGFDCVMRLFHAGKQSEQQKTRTLKDLGYSAEHLRPIDERLKKPDDGVIIAGTTRSLKCNFKIKSHT